MKYTINTPEGTRDRLFAECRDRRRVQNALTALFRRRSYAEVSTPEVEFYDIFLQSGNPMPQEAMLKIIDRSGKKHEAILEGTLNEDEITILISRINHAQKEN